MTHSTAADFARRHVEEIINGRRLELVDELYAPDAVAEIFRIAGGQIAEVWVYPDTLGIMRQFGISPGAGGG